MGGKRQANTLSALIQNFDTVEKVIETSANSSGSALKENEKYLDSIQGKIDQFTNAVQTLWSNVLDSDVVKFFVNLATKIVKAVDALGTIPPLLAAIATYSMIKNKMGPLAFFKGLFEAGKQGISWTESHIRNLKNVKLATDDLHKSTTTLTQVQLKEKLTSQGLTDNVAEEIVAKTNLGKATDELKASTLDAALKEKGFSQEKRESILQTVFDTQATDENSQANKENAASNQQASAAEDKNGQERKENIAITKQDNAETQKNTQLNNQNAQSNNKLGASIKKLGGKIGAFAKEYAGTLIMLGTTLLTVVLTKAVDGIVETMAEMENEFNESVAELDATNSELSSLESQLKDINKQIDELNESTPLSFTDQEELSRLKAQSEEIRRQIDLVESLKKQQAIGVNSDAIAMADKYRDVGVKSGKTTDQVTGDAVKVSGGIGVAATGAAATMAAFGAAMSWNVVGWIALAAAAITAAVGGIAYAVADNEDKVGDSLDNMREQYSKLQYEYETARANYQANASKKNKKKFEDAQEAFNSYQSNMAGYMSEMDSYYSQIKQNWDQATTDQKREYIEWADTMDTWAIQTGGANAKSNAISRIFGDEATGKIAKVRDDALSNLEAYNINLDDSDIERLRSMGIYLYEVEDYFKNVVKTESEFVDNDLEEVAKDINKITDGLGSLKSAFEEVIDEGVLTAKTIMSLKEALNIGSSSTEGLTDAWREYLDVMMSGTATTEEMIAATERLAHGYLEDALSTDALNPNTKHEYIAQLRSLGVTNAEEYVDDMLQKNMVKELEQSFDVIAADDYSKIRDRYLSDGGNIARWNGLSADNIQELAKEYGMLNDISDEALANIKEKYGDEASDIDGVVSKLQEKKEIERQIADQQKQINDYNDWINKKGNYRQLKETLDGFKTVRDEYESFSDDVKNFNASDYYSNWDGTMTNSQTGKIISSYDYTDLIEENQRYQKWMSENKAEFDAYQAAKAAFDEIIREGQSLGYVNRDGTLNVNAPIAWQTNYNNLQSKLKDAEDYIETKLTPDIQLKLDLQTFNDDVDKIQDVYSTIKSIATEYNTQGYLSLDNLQALLNLQPEYLACLQMVNGQLTINQDALQSMLETKLDDAEATAVQTAITQLNALAQRKEQAAIEDTSGTIDNTILKMGSYSEALGTIAENAIGAAGSVALFNAAIKGASDAKDNGLVSDDEINQILTNFNNSVELINGLRGRLSSNFNNILDPGSNTSGQDVAETEWERLNSYYERQLALITNERDLIEAEIDKAEAQGGKAAAKYYEDLKRNSEEEKTLLENKKTALEQYLAANANSIDPDTWTEYNNEINETAVAIKECETNIIEMAEALREIDIHYFDQITEEISRLGQELEFVNGLLEDEEVADEDGNWSAAAITRMGMYMNQIEAAAADTQRYQDEIAKLNKQYDAGELSEEQYQERLGTLTDGLYDSINAQEDARDSIVELNEARIDAIKEGIEKEIEAYEDYIDVVKESLDAERDLYDFKKNVNKQSKDIAAIERRIASLSGSTAASDVAERRKLEAQLVEAKEGLNDTYYDHSRDAQQNALDSEAESYRKSQERRIKELEKTLEETETLIYNSMMDVLLNADVVYNELNTITDKYGDILSDELKQPWNEASNRAKQWKGELEGDLTSLTGEGGAITLFANGVSEKLSGSWNTAKNAVIAYSDFLTGTELGNKFSKSISGFGEQIQTIVDKWGDVKDAADEAYIAQTRTANVGGNPNLGDNYVGGTLTSNNSAFTATNIRKLQEILNDVFIAGIAENGKWDAATEAALRNAQSKMGITVTGKYDMSTKKGISNYLNKQANYIKTSAYGGYMGGGLQFAADIAKKLPPPFFAKGTTGTKRDQWAITDEPWLGDELVLVPTAQGTLSYMRKGTGVVPADLTANLMEWGQFTPESLNLGTGVNVNMINNAVIKPQYDFDFDSLVHVDHCDQGTLKDLEKMVDSKIDKFSKDLNYSIKRFAR